MLHGYNTSPMHRAVVVAGWLALGGCSAPEPARPSAFGGAGSSIVAVDASQRVVDATTAMDAVEPQEAGLDPLAEVLREVARCDREEQHAVALRLLEDARTRFGPTPELSAARAGVLRDLGRRSEAHRELVGLRDRDEGSFGPGLWFELAELSCAVGDFDCATAALAALRSSVPGASFVKEREADVRALDRCVDRREAPRTVRVRDLLGDLRGASDPARRLAVLRMLETQAVGVRDLAHRIAVGDDDGALRAAAVVGVRLDSDQQTEFCAVALTDGDPRVRRAGAVRVSELPLSERVPLLLAALAAESDPATFALLDAGLCAGTTLLPAEAGKAGDAAYRASIVSQRRASMDGIKETSLR
jgi:hypothetical protein